MFGDAVETGNVGAALGQLAGDAADGLLQQAEPDRLDQMLVETGFLAPIKRSSCMP